MKKYVLLYSCFLLTCMSLYAQVSIGFQAGYTGATTQFKTAAGVKRNTGPLRTWHADMVFNMPLNGVDGLYLQPLLRYVVKGTYLTPLGVTQNGYTEAAYRLDLRYLELPFNVVYKIRLGGDNKLVIGAGPYAAYSLGGSYSANIYSGQALKISKQDLGFDSRDATVAPGTNLGRWDTGLNAMLGVELSGMLLLNANYSYGMLNLDNAHAANIRNRYLGVSLGILLNREDY